MKGSYTPWIRDPGWCSACHEYARPALHPAQQVDPARWPEGLPIIETYSEYLAGPHSGTFETCQTCHMPILDEESSTYDITPQDLIPSVTQGWLREYGEVRHHSFTGTGLPTATLGLDLSVEGDDVLAVVDVTNGYAGHAVPTGTPLRQLLLRVEAVDDSGTPVPAGGGQAIPAAGGWRHQGMVGEGVVADGASLIFAGQALADATAARFVRSSGDWDDYEGPGTGSFEGLAVSEKGIPLEHVLGERTVLSVSGDTAHLDEPPPDLQDGDRVYLVGPDDAAGAPGWLYGKVLVDAEGRHGVAQYRAVDMASDNRIAPDSTASSSHRFALPASGELTVTAVLVARRYASTVANRYGWDPEDDELARLSMTYSAME